MIYAYDEPVQLPVRDLYDTQIMAMAINTAKDMYEKGQQEMKDFAKTYGDFYTPIINDQNWFDQNVTGRLRGALDEIYSQGINPLTNPQARVFLQRIINTMPYGDIAKVRQSADNAREFLKAKQRLWLEGKYNPIYDKYDGPSLSDYATVGDNGQGIWERLSPTPIQNMSDFSKAYFDNITPIERHTTKNGISYTVSEITEPMLYDIADRHFNDLVTTPQGQLMYKMYKDQLGSDEAARKAFNDAVVSGNLDRRKYADNFDQMKQQKETMDLRRQQLQMSKQLLQMKIDAKQKEQKEKEQQAARGWTERQRLNIMLNGRPVGIGEASGAKGLSTSDRKAYAQNYNAYQTTSLTPGDATVARLLLSNGVLPENVDNYSKMKRSPMSFSEGSGLNFTSHRQYVYAGKRISNGSLSNRLKKYMAKNHVRGYMTDVDNISVNNMWYSDTGSKWDINGYVKVKKSDLEGFGEKLDNALKLIGASEVTETVMKRATSKSIVEKNETFVIIPVTRTIDSKVLSDSEINRFADKISLSSSVAAKRQSNYEEDDLDNLIINSD